EVIGREIIAEEETLDRWRESAQKSGMNSYQIESLVKMFIYYSRNGLEGNSNVLSWLLKEKPNSFYSFIKRDIAGDI
ncbi:MAG: SDR family oxidoreductase, partial [Bacillota bacterium]